MEPVALGTLLRSATARLSDAGCLSPAADAAVLLAHVVDCEPGELHRRVLLGHELAADDPRAERFEAAVVRREAREPLQHITGAAWFAGVELEVGPGVFVPRPETELLVERAVARVLWLAGGAGPEAQVEVVDLCAGSGAVVLGLAGRLGDRAAAGDAVPGTVLRAVERDPRAAEYAERNIDATGVTVDLRVSDAREEFVDREGQVDLVVSNPPYVPQGVEPLEPEAREHDPAAALYGGSEDGLALPLQLARHARSLLRPGGWLLMEHDDSQGESLPAALAGLGYDQVADHHDLAGRPRVVEAHWPGRG
ncbi:peptide chain release factor N(5)-glutamine methyltransferase [Kytococcus sedentarius]|uniref:peptide chain release factor N(5)-glutamine methyltransferase n=1 Tax=Kytococcus sedentarius TaxID=1276 RepID=UPI0035BBAF53